MINVNSDYKIHDNELFTIIEGFFYQRHYNFYILKENTKRGNMHMFMTSKIPTKK